MTRLSSAKEITPEASTSGIKVWWTPQIPGKAFEWEVPDFATANLVCELLAQYDLFQLDENIKPDFSNAGGIVFVDSDGQWSDIEFEDEDYRAYAEGVLAKRRADLRT